ncbi:uncharacterized protein CXorf58 homolog isoform X2 [Nematostella vectensis]|uniref:uncharacterized protein CXorf58 homolog isoform X2 n=1 Tax=Nematostella vectensis TaxID=45351 RepID=UPI0020770BC7|nr:uncharacterized protein CXorf58 homolog isoform X2 [Nematostella vectensis]
MGQNMDETPPNKRHGPTRMEAVQRIERNWCSYRDKQMFKLLKYAICAAEHSLTFEVLRKVSPLEADLLRDPAVNARVRFRFGGIEFPPIIMFKIYINSSGQGLKYMSGKKTIKASSQAASDSLRLMGNRKFYDQLTADLCQHEKDKITDEIDVTTMKDYMKYLSHLDEAPPDAGGKSNLWRRLTLDAIPRKNIVHDIFSYVISGLASPRLIEECQDLLSGRPATQAIQVARIEAIPQYHKNAKPNSSGQNTGRRSRKAKQRVEKMRRLYGFSSPKPGEDLLAPRSTPDLRAGEDLFDEEDWEQEGDKLYEWAQNLSMEELMTP